MRFPNTDVNFKYSKSINLQLISPNTGCANCVFLLTVYRSGIPMLKFYSTLGLERWPDFCFHQVSQKSEILAAPRRIPTKIVFYSFKIVSGATVESMESIFLRNGNEIKRMVSENLDLIFLLLHLQLYYSWNILTKFCLELLQNQVRLNANHLLGVIFR